MKLTNGDDPEVSSAYLHPSPPHQPAPKLPGRLLIPVGKTGLTGFLHLMTSAIECGTFH